MQTLHVHYLYYIDSHMKRIFLKKKRDLPVAAVRVKSAFSPSLGQLLF